MAKLGEGDKRWIVEERTDGTNVHNWHWAEKDCIEWAKKRLGELLENVQILEGQGSCWIQTAKLASVEGEAYVNIRKGKIIPGYELKVRLNWEGEVRDSAGETVVAKGGGFIELPYIADENADEEPELKVSTSEGGPAGERLREAMFAQGKSVLIERVRRFIKDMAAGGPAKDELSAKIEGKPAPAAANSAKAIASKAAPTSAGSKAVAKDLKAAARDEDKKGFRTIKMTQQFNCRKEDLFDVLMDERRWMAFTQSKAQISREVGSSFSLFDGAVAGVIQKLEPPSLIIEKWRFNSWEDGIYSTVCMTIEEPEVGVTILKLTQSNVPEEDRFGNATVYETTLHGWREHIFNRIKAVFGYGA